MRIRQFIELPEYENMATSKLKTGERFLTGKQVIAQKETKVVGNDISYYIVTHADDDGMNVSYKPIYDKMEE